MSSPQEYYELVGRCFKAFSDLEGSLDSTIGTFMKTDQSVARAVLINMSFSGKVQLLGNLLFLKKKSLLNDEYKKNFEHLEEVRIFRNNLAHAQLHTYFDKEEGEHKFINFNMKRVIRAQKKDFSKNWDYKNWLQEVSSQHLEDFIKKCECLCFKINMTVIDIKGIKDHSSCSVFKNKK